MGSVMGRPQAGRLSVGDVVIDIDIRFAVSLERFARALEIGAVDGHEQILVAGRFAAHLFLALQVTERGWNPVHQHHTNLFPGLLESQPQREQGTHRISIGADVGYHQNIGRT